MLKDVISLNVLHQNLISMLKSKIPFSILPCLALKLISKRIFKNSMLKYPLVLYSFYLQFCLHLNDHLNTKSFTTISKMPLLGSHSNLLSETILK